MILFLTLIYIGILFIVVKAGWVPWNLWAKISPLFFMLLALIVLILPLQFYAPSGSVLVVQPTVQIVPPVEGLVEEVAVGPNQQVAKGDVLFRLETTKYQATVDRLEADLKLARIRLDQSTELVKRGAGRQLEVDRTQAQVDSLTAQLASARWDLQHTVVRAPGDGVVSNVEALQPGARVVSMPFQQAMVFVDSKRVLIAQIQQIYLRHIKPGQPAEVTFKMLPGEVFDARVEMVIPGTAQGQVAPSGSLLLPREMVPLPHGVRLILADQGVAGRLTAGAVGTATIYSGKMETVYIIKRVMIWMDAWLNYIVPL